MNRLNNLSVKLEDNKFNIFADSTLLNSGSFKESELFIDSLLEMRQITNKQWRQLDRELIKLNRQYS